MPLIPLACELPPPDPKNLVAILVRALPAVFLVGFPTVLALGLVVGPRHTTTHFSCGESTGEIAKRTTVKYAMEAFPQWARADPSRDCPTSLRELDPYMDRPSELDPWGRSYVFTCGQGRLYVMSLGQDGRSNTADDLWSHQ